MNVLVIGAGRMAYGLVFDFLKNEKIHEITVIDHSASALDDMKKHFNNTKLSFQKISADNLKELKPFFNAAAGVLSAVPYDYNVDLTELAINTRTHFVDLGGNNTVVNKQFKMHEQAKANDIGIFPDCGLAPGMTSVVAPFVMDQLARVDAVKIRVGGLPLTPRTPLNYKLVFSVHGLINEYIEPAVILEDGRIKTVKCLTGLETLEFPSPFGKVEAFYTSGGISTMPYTFAGKVINLDYKTIRYPGHAHIVKHWIDMGFADKNATFEYRGQHYNMRDVFESMLNATLQYESDDVVLIRVTATGQKEGKEKTISLQAIEYADKKNNLSAMMRTTAFPAAIILQMLIEGTISQRGVLKQEESVPAYPFMTELEKRGIYFDKIDD